MRDEAIPQREELGVAKRRTAAAGKSLILHEDLIALRKELLDFEAVEVLAVRPAAGEVGFAIDAVIERAGKGEVRRKQRLDGGAVLRFVGGVASADDFGRCFHAMSVSMER